MREAESKSERIVRELLAEYASGRQAPGVALPGEQTLARRFGVARETVRKALDELQRQGVVERRKGAGTFLSEGSARKTGLIGFLVPDLGASGFFGDVHREMEKLAAGNGYRLSVATIQPADAETMIRETRRRARELAVARVEGVVFRPLLDERCAKVNREVVRIFEHTETPVVLLDADVVEPPERSACDLVSVNNVEAGRQVAVHLLSRGYRRIGFLMNGPSIGTNSNWRNRLFGVAGELALRGCETAVRMLTFDPRDVASVRRHLGQRGRQDAVVCGNDETAAALVRSLAAVGVRVPEEVAVVGFDDQPAALRCDPPLTTVRQPTALIAKSALSALLARIRHPNSPAREINLRAPIVIRRST